MKMCHAIPVKPGYIPHDEIYVMCEPWEYDLRVLACMRRHPKWFDREPVPIPAVRSPVPELAREFSG